MECSFCHRRECDGSNFSVYSSHEPRMVAVPKLISLYYCDVCGQQIVYDEEQKKLFGFTFPTIGKITMDENDEAYTAYASSGSDFHFHNKCFKEHIKPHFLQRDRDQYGHEEFLLPNNDEIGIIQRLGVE